jgi:hypothetical protein
MWEPASAPDPVTPMPNSTLEIIMAIPFNVDHIGTN